MKKFCILLLANFGVIAGAANLRAESAQTADLQTDAMHGVRISAEDAKALEETVAKNPEDLSARAKLLGYYCMKQRTSPAAIEAHREHVLWIINNHPDTVIGGTPFLETDPITDPNGYHDVTEAWLKQVEAHPQDAIVLGNAARCFFIHDKEQAEKLLRQAEEVDPKNPNWPDMLGHLYALDKYNGGGAKALAELEKAEAIDTDEGSKTVRLVELAKSAYEAGDVVKAKKYAGELLTTGTKDPQNWNYGNAIHHGNNVLGRIALQEGKTPQADEFLLKAGGTPGSPQLNSFGPNMCLAKELLEAGQKDTVLQYFEACRKFWKNGGKQLDDWTALVKGGSVPEFGGNLMY
jgi:tetratricopeptide (TPR) repeat protein